MEENSIPNKETRGSSLEKRELFPNEEEYANDTELECVEHIGDFHVYRDAKGDRLYVVHVSGFVAGYGFGNLWSRSHRGYPDKAEREKEKGTVEEALFLGKMAREVYRRLDPDKQQSTYLTIITSDGKGPERKRLFERYFILEADVDNPWHCRVKGLKV